MSDSYKTLEENGSRFNPWAKGFLIQAGGDGVISCLTYEDYVRQGKTVNDTLAQLIDVTAGQYMNVRVVKVYSAGNTTGVTDVKVGV